MWFRDALWNSLQIWLCLVSHLFFLKPFNDSVAILWNTITSTVLNEWQTIIYFFYLHHNTEAIHGLKNNDTESAVEVKQKTQKKKNGLIQGKLPKNKDKMTNKIEYAKFKQQKQQQ